MVELATQRYEGANHTHFTEAVRAGGHRPQPAHGAPHSHQSGHRQSPQPALTTTPFPPPADAPGWDADPAGRQPSRLVGGPGTQIRPALGVDDATGTAVNAVFRTGEDTRGYFMLLDGLIQRWGIPLALYSDRHAVFKHNARRRRRRGESHPVHPWPAGIGHPGRSSPAHPRPRAEWNAWRRPFRTAWSPNCAWRSRQDHWPGHGGAADFLPRFNARFAVQPRASGRGLPPSGRRPVSFPRPCASSTPARWAGTTR